jgi:glycosyltransferase involved in cell wall biosynthesis
MAGIGIRYLELARRLPPHGVEVVLLSPGPLRAASELGLDAVEVRPFEPGRIARTVEDCDGVVAQGHLANHLLLEAPEIPTAIDLYDPWLVENLHYHEALGLDPYRSDHATWVLQMSRGDFFLCSSREQRLFYLGFLAAVGRLNPERLDVDPELRELIAAVPFGVPDEPPPHRPLLGERVAGERRLLFGGLYDWYDPWPVLEALASMRDEPWKLYVIRNPNPDSTPQRLFREVEEWCRSRELWGRRVEALDWIPFERRYDLLRDVDALVATHRPGLETELSFRTRFLDALVAGCPVLTTDGGTLSRLLREWDAGWLVGPGDAQAVREALGELLAGGERVRARVARGLEGVRRFRWDEVLAPLVAFCRSPRIDPTKERFAHPLPTTAPPDAMGFRLRRRLRLLLRGAG